MLPTGLWTGHFIERAFLHLFPVSSIFISTYLFREVFKSGKLFARVDIQNIIGYLLISTVIIFSLLLPITKYSNTPFMYSPSTYLHQNSFLAERGAGSVAVMGESSVTGYYALINNRTNLFTNIPYNSTSLVDMDTIMTSFRVYTKSAFIPENPIYIDIRTGLEKGKFEESYYSRVYDVDEWHRIYRKYITTR